MESVQVTCHADRTELVLQGLLDVPRVRAVYQSLNQALVRALPVELHAADVERVDAAGLQLLLAFYRTARDRGLAPHWRSVSTALRNGSEALGITGALELPT
ncbi:MAG: STAS domain-containing protein [Gammaproteobacteria bacterium]|nr:STAS domain-containing protein [Gammaproteobacteria bacterium]